MEICMTALHDTGRLSENTKYFTFSSFIYQHMTIMLLGEARDRINPFKMQFHFPKSEMLSLSDDEGRLFTMA